MLNQNQSKRVNLLKLLLVIPLLALFLVGFNTKEVIKFSEKSSSTISQQDIKVELVIDKNSTDKILNKNTEFFKKRGVSIQFKGIKRNSKDEITSILIAYDNNAGEIGNYKINQNSPIEPIKVVFIEEDEGNHKIVVGKAIETNTETVNPNNHDIINVQVRKEGDKEIILLEGKEITRKDLANQGKVEKMFVKMLSISDTISADMKINKVSLDNETIQLIEPSDTINSKNKKDFILIKKADSIIYKTTEIVIDKKDDGNLFILDTNNAVDYPNHFKVVTSDLSKPLFILNGKEITAMEFENLDHDKFDTISILNGDEAEKKYGKKAENGVVQITMKKEK